MQKVAVVALVALLAGCLSAEKPIPPPAPVEEAPPERDLEVFPVAGNITYRSRAEVQACPARAMHVWTHTEGLPISSVGLVKVDLLIEWEPTDPAFTRMGFLWHTFPKDSGVGGDIPGPETDGVSPLRWTLAEGDFKEIRERGSGTTALMAWEALCHQENGPAPTVEGEQAFRITGNATYEV